MYGLCIALTLILFRFSLEPIVLSVYTVQYLLWVEFGELAHFEGTCSHSFH